MALTLADEAVSGHPCGRAPTAPAWRPTPPPATGGGAARLPATAPGPGRPAGNRPRRRDRGPYLQLLGPAPPARAASEEKGPATAGAADAGSGVSPPAPFVGRDPELAVLGAAWDQAAAGARHVVVVTGEGGIGKTRLATEAARRVAAQGGLVLFGRCDQEAIVPYQPIVEALDGYVAATPADELPGPGRGGPGRAGDGAAVAPRAPTAPRWPRRAGPPVRRRHDAGGVGGGRPCGAAGARRPAMGGRRHPAAGAPPAPTGRRCPGVGGRHLARPRRGPGSVLGDVIHALDRDGWVRRLPLRGLEESDVRVLVRQSSSPS